MNTLLTRLFNHEQLTRDEARGLMLDMTAGRYPDTQVAALLAAYRMRDITTDELLGFREALMEVCVPVDFSPYRPVDIVGTGGDGKNTFNISTCACFVVAGAGYKVAKHGNYGATSVSGASDVISEHGIRFTTDRDVLRRSMDQAGIAYLHAQLFHPAMKAVANVRKTLGTRTLFNLLGPMINPCRPAYQLLGVSNLALMRLYTYAFRQTGIEFAVVGSLDNYDEISLTDEFKVTGLHDEHIYRPQELGFVPALPAELYGGQTRQEASRIFDAVLTGHGATPAQKHCVTINAAFAIRLMEPGKEIDECIDIARESLESGRALASLQKFIEINR